MSRKKKNCLRHLSELLGFGEVTGLLVLLGELDGVGIRGCDPEYQAKWEAAVSYPHYSPVAQVSHATKTAHIKVVKRV